MRKVSLLLCSMLMASAAWAQSPVPVINQEGVAPGTIDFDDSDLNTIGGKKKGGITVTPQGAAPSAQDQAEEDKIFEKVYKNPDSLQLNLELAQVQLRNGNLKGAAATLGRLLEFYPNEALAQLLLAQTEARLGNTVEAKEYFQAVLNNPSARPEQQANAQKSLDALIDSEKLWRYGAQLQAGIGEAMNPLNSSRYVTIFGYDVPTNANTNYYDTTWIYFASATIEKVIESQTNHSVVFSASSFNQQYRSYSVANLDVNTATIAYQAGDVTNRVVVGLNTSATSLSGKGFINSTWGSASYQTALSSNALVNLGVNYGYNNQLQGPDYSGSSVRSNWMSGLVLGGKYFFNSDWLGELSLSRYRYAAQVDYESYNMNYALASLSYFTNYGVFGIFGSSITNIYSGIDPLSNAQRYIQTNTYALIGLASTPLAHADSMPPISGVISVATEPVTIKTTSVEGKVNNRTVGVGQPIYLNDEIKTGPNNKLQILLKDQTVFNVGPNSVMTIDKFVFDPTKGELSVGIQKGAFKFVSGKVSNSNPDAMKVKLPNATISVRGTGVAGNVAPDGTSTVVLLHGIVDVASATNSSTLSKSGWGVQVGPTGTVGQPTITPPDVMKNIMGSVAQIKGALTSNSATASNATSNTPTTQTVLNSNSGLTASELSNSIDASQFVSAATAQSFKASLLNSINTQTALNGNPDTIPVSILNDAIRNNPAVWAGILQSMGMPPDTIVPDAMKQSTLAQYINSDFAKYYALLVFPKVFASSDLVAGNVGPLGLVTFNTGGIAMACQNAGACGTGVTATINSQTVAINYSTAQVTNTYNVSYANFNGSSGTISGSASSGFTAVNAQNIQLPLGTNSGPGSTSLNMIGQFGSIGNLVGKFSTLTTTLAQSGSAVMRAGYQVKGQ